MTDQTRISIDFRTVHLDEVESCSGAPNYDSACGGTTMMDYLRGTDQAHISDELIEQYKLAGSTPDHGVMAEAT